MRRALALAAAAAVVLAAGPAVAVVARKPDVVATEAGARLALISCTIRNTGGGWAILANSAHVPSGCTGLIQRADHLELQHPVGAVAVSSLTVATDETFARAGMRCGASVGLALSNIYLYEGDPGSPPLDPADVVSPTGNLWILGYLRLAA